MYRSGPTPVTTSYSFMLEFYIHFSSNAGLGKVGAWYISSGLCMVTVYNKGGYCQGIHAVKAATPN